MKNLVVFHRRWERLFLRWSIVIIPSVYIFHAIVQFFVTLKFPTALDNYGRILTELSLMMALYFANDLFLNLPHTIAQLFANGAL